jgi:hypothetical protein
MSIVYKDLIVYAVRALAGALVAYAASHPDFHGIPAWLLPVLGAIVGGVPTTKTMPVKTTPEA